MTKRLKGVANLPLAPFVGVLFGVVAAILILNTPSWMLEKLVSGISLATVLPAAAPPLGDTARTLLAVITGVLVALPLWLVMRAIEGEIHKSRVAKARGSNINPADVATSESRRRSPIRAGTELGAPLMSDEALSNGGELLLSESVATDSAASPRDPVRQVQEETLLDLGSWKQQPEAPESRALPPVSWDEPSTLEAWDQPIAAELLPNALENSPKTDDVTPSAIDFITRTVEEPEAEAPPVALPWETAEPSIDIREAEQALGTLDPFDLPAPTEPVAAQPEAHSETHNVMPSPVSFDTISFETVPVDELLEVENKFAPKAAPRVADILDSAAFLTPDMLGDDFRDESADLGRGLSVAPAEPGAVEAGPPAADSLETEPALEQGLQIEAESPVSFETAPAWQDDVPFDLAPPSPFAPTATSSFASDVVPPAPAQSSPSIVAQGEDNESLLDLLDRLEAALAKRSLDSNPDAPAPTNLAALREILSQTHAPNNSPRAAGGGW